MTTATAAPPDTHAGVYHPGMDLTRLRASKTNPRKHFDGGKLTELALSLQEHGVLEPLIVRPLKGSTTNFEIVAGERRFRAATIAQLDKVPVIERPLTDEQVLEIQLIENIQRDDLTALEQARGYRALIDSNPSKHTAVTIATRVGMSAAWVWDRLKLNDLIPEAKELLEQERMATGHAILIARQKPEDQKRIIAVGSGYAYGSIAGGLWQHVRAGLLDDETRKPGKYDGVKAVSVRELEVWIADHIRFDVTHAAKAVPLEFETVAAEVEQAAALPGRGKKVIPITFRSHLADDARDPNERTYGVGSWERADGTDKSKTCEHSVLGVVVAGSEHYGKTLQVCIARDKCLVHFGSVIKQKEKNAKLRESGKPAQAAARESAADKRRQAEEAKERALEARYRVFKPALLKATQAAAAKVKAPNRAQFQAMLKDLRLPASTTVATLPKALMLQAIAQSFQESYFWADKAGTKLLTWPKLLGVDVKACEPKAEKKAGEA